MDLNRLVEARIAGRISIGVYPVFRDCVFRGMFRKAGTPIVRKDWLMEKVHLIHDNRYNLPGSVKAELFSIAEEFVDRKIIHRGRNLRKLFWITSSRFNLKTVPRDIYFIQLVKGGYDY
jgi:hypothetical protein